MIITLALKDSALHSHNEHVFSKKNSMFLTAPIEHSFMYVLNWRAIYPFPVLVKMT